MFALRRGAVLTLTLLLGIALAACSSNGGDDNGGNGGEASNNGGSTGGTATVSDGAVEISADNLEFNVSTIEATAGESFTITLVNNDSAPHNISIYTEEGGDEIVIGDTAAGGETVTVEVPALDAGTYYFHCDIHPDMNGDVVVS